jgi:ketosteroid isomerase-like protein
VANFVHAWETADIDALVALLTDDVFMSMPPLPLEYEGRDVVAGFCAGMFDAGRRFDLVPTRANGQPAFGPTCALLPASATGPACSSSPSAATGSAP